MTALLEVSHVSKQFGSDTKALSDVSFSVHEGEFVSIIGPSGAGKSTLLRCINRMIDASSGEITFDNMSVINLKKKELKKVRTKIGMIFQHYNLVNRLSVIENTLHGNLGKKSTLAGVLGIYSQEEKGQAAQILQALGLDEHMFKRADQLSGGQKQRVGIARALIQNPRMLLCDEPIASLDPNSAKIIMDHLRDITSTMGITALVNLHQVDVAMKYSDRIIGINHGQVVYNGSPQNITSEDIQRIYGSEAEDLLFDIGGIHAS
ncbi:phosphonate ABC transporter ATP-binding protein [Radiobacillus kanasensis]|uniref:phosphonate ABC transporter ATP-binding protein n=1 Tax=Radiobacillus kanasensis TaxID=2844358 RepID=UPI001E508744|nr:phosphonate ABC transporter ATP-binding protein [Radiobacillus kanasensis]UFT99308.1 phosphonate ABC transporter ATP-binding protein [Radiobacillus kanasensis]